MTRKGPKILVLRGGALGDFIVTLPVLAALRKHWPEAHIELSGNATAAELARSRGLLDAVHSQHEARWAALFGSAPLSTGFAEWLGSFDLVVNYWPDPDGELRQRFPVRAGQTFVPAAAMPTRTPAAAHYCDALRPLGIETNDYFHLLRKTPANERSTDSSDAARGSANSETLDRIAIHPGSGSPRKNWPHANWRELMAALTPFAATDARGHHRKILHVLGDAEFDSWQPLLAAPPLADRIAAGSIRVIAKAPLEQLVAELSRCRLFLGHDSGVSHLAAACGLRCVLLFGPTDPAMWAPPAPNVRVLHGGQDLSSISVSAVLDEISANT